MTGIDGQLVIEQAKLTDYLLDPTHRTGGAKAAFFDRFGFRRTDPTALAAALEHHARHRPVTRTIENSYGIKREVRCDLRTPDGRNPCIVAIWLQPARTATHRLITAYPYQAPGTPANSAT